MNPIGILCTALSSGCSAGLVVLLNQLRTAQDAIPAPDVEDLWDGEWAPMVEEVSEELKSRRKVREGRVETLRGIYLQQLEDADAKPAEVPAR